MKHFIFTVFLLGYTTLNAQVAHKRVVKLMGSRFDITIVAKDLPTANAYIDTAVAEISRIENLISEWMPHTPVSEINRNAGIKPVVVDQELFDLTERAIGFSKLTDGAFDISFAAADKIWKYDGSMTTLPSPEAVKESVKKIGYQHIILDREQRTIFLELPGMKIGFGSIGKGYAADKTKEFLIKKGVVAGIVNASGDMNTWGRQPDGKEWTIGITDPKKTDRVFAVFPLTDGAVVTSGNYEKYIEIGNKRYSHIIDPRTGYPATGLSSVTVFAKSAEMANGISTSVMVLGKTAGLHLINSLPQVSALLIDNNGRIFYSDTIDRKKIKRKKN